MKVTVLLRYPNAGQTLPVTLVDGTELGWTKRRGVEYVFEMSVEDFNKHAEGIFTAERQLGYEAIPEIVIEPGEDAEPPLNPLIPSHQDIIKAATENSMRLGQYADLLKVDRAELQRHIESAGSGLYLSGPARWIKVGESPK